MKHLEITATRNVTIIDSLRTVLKPDDIFFLNSESKRDVLNFLIEKMSTHRSVNCAEQLRNSIYEREKLMSTGIGLGIGVPHVRIDSVSDLNMVVAICKRGLNDYESLDSEPVKMIFMISANSTQHSQYIKTLSLLSKQVKHKSVRDKLLDTNDPKAFYEILTTTRKE